MSQTAHVAVRSLSHVFRHGETALEVLRGLTFDARWGEFLTVIGPSGCGKSTLLRAIGGLLQPSAGSVSIGGLSPREAQRSKEIGFVFQEPALLPWRSVRRNVELPLEVNPSGSRVAVREPQALLNLVGLSEFAEYRPWELSGGMQQRVALARALVFAPALLLMDEPFGALDEITRAAMRYELLRVWEADRKTVLFVTHSIHEAALLSDRVVVLTPRPGRITAIMDIDLPRPRTEATELSAAFLDSARRLRGLLREG